MSVQPHSSSSRSQLDDHSTLVYLVGAGPGDPGLLTLRGAEVLARADVVLFDGLSNEAILQHAPTAEHICVGKHGRTRIWRQDEINEEILNHASQGKVVVRLKGGDPAVFARTAEEIDAVRNAGFRFEVVPGITAALAAGSFAGIPITHRGLASAVALVTGHEEPGKPASALDWPALARFPGTLVIYMGVTTASVWTKALLDGGKPADTPVAILRRCSLPDQQTLLCRLDEVAENLTPASKIRPPVIVIVGPVANLAQQGCWFTARPLFGRKILITRPESQADDLAGPLAELGAEVFTQPAISISAPADSQPLTDAISNVQTFQWLAFTSRNAVDSFFRELNTQKLDARSLASIKIAVVGTRTADRLAEYHIIPDLVSQVANADQLAEELIQQTTTLQKILWPRASRGPSNFADLLNYRGHQVTSVVAYQHQDTEHPDPTIKQLFTAEQVDWTTVTSSVIARSLVTLFGDKLRTSKLVSLSPKTSETLRQLGFPPTVEAQQATMDAVIQAIVDHETKMRS